MIGFARSNPKIPALHGSNISSNAPISGHCKQHFDYERVAGIKLI
jgi:hypothetical protein